MYIKVTEKQLEFLKRLSTLDMDHIGFEHHEVDFPDLENNTEMETYDSDPHKVIPDNFQYQTITVVGYSAPTGSGVTQLMARIQYKDGSRTTQDYLQVLWYYLKDKTLSEMNEICK